MAYPISDVTRRVQYTGSAGTGPYNFTFEILEQTDIAVYKNSTLLTLTTNYTVTINGDGTGSITLTSAATSSDTVTIFGDRAIKRETDFVTGGDLLANSLNEELDSLVIFDQQLEEKVGRTLRVPSFDNPSLDMTLPAVAQRAGKVLTFDELGAPISGPSVDEVGTVLDNLANITTVADDINGPNTIGTVATNIADVNTVVSNIANVNTVAGISSNVTSVAGNASNINTVAGNNANVTTVAGISSNVTTVAGISGNVTTVAGISADVQTVADMAAEVTNFADVYQGGKSANPTLRNDGSALQAGDLYFNTGSKQMRVFDGSAWVQGTADAPGTYTVQNFNGDGSTTSFTLSTNPVSENNTQVYIGGVYQQKDQYSLSGSTLTFSSAPPSGANNIEVVSIAPMSVGATTADLVTYAPEGTGAVASNVQTKLREFVSVKDFGADVTGVTSCVSAFQSSMSEMASRGGGTLVINKGTYLFNVTGDSDTILIPSNVTIECEPGVVFKWGYWGSPLFAIVNKSNVRWIGNGAQFVWSGTFGTTSGARDAFSYGREIPAYEWCCHIACVGSENVDLSDFSCSGITTSNNQNAFILFRGTSAGGLTGGNKIRGLQVDDVCQGILFGEQKRFLIDGIRSDRYSIASAGLYGPGHVVYVIPGSTASENGEIKNIIDNGTQINAFNSGSHSVSLKNLKNTIVSGLLSKRVEGVLNFNSLENVDVDFHYYTASTTDDTGCGPIFASDPVTPNKYVILRGVVIQDSVRNSVAVNFGGMTDGSKNLYCDVDVKIVRTTNGTESTPAIFWVGNYGNLTVDYTNKGTIEKMAVTVGNSSNDNNIKLNALGSKPQPLVTVLSGQRNTFYCNGDSSLDTDPNDFTPANGNAIIWNGHRQYSSYKVIGSVSNPGGTFQLPVPGSYLVHISLKASDSNHARSGLYWVVFDDASAFDFTTAQLIGTQISKGGVAPSALGLTVSSTGLCTVTSTSPANTWVLNYGYRQLCHD